MNMKPILAALVLLGGVATTFGAPLTITNDGSDGALNLPANPANVEIDLSLATTGDGVTVKWDSPNGGNAGNGIYDPLKWAVVFKYSSVNIPAGVTVTFKNHPSHAPVVWLVQGSATISGTLSVNGTNGVVGANSLTPVEPGPGGFRGGPSGPAGTGAGLGPGGGGPQGNGAYGSSYGNPQILPLIGGSGGGAFGAGRSGSSAGGAILIAASTTIQVAGVITASPGLGYDGNGNPSTSYSTGSGGAIKLIADQVTGTGTLNATTAGRVRLEANSLADTIVFTPSTIAVAPGATPTIFQSDTSPVVKIISVDGLPSPADPAAPLISSADIAIQKNTPVTVVLKTYNFATAGAVVALRIANKFGGASTVNATLQGGGTSTESTWTVSTTLAPGFVTLQARATAP